MRGGPQVFSDKEGIVAIKERLSHSEAVFQNCSFACRQPAFGAPPWASFAIPHSRQRPF